MSSYTTDLDFKNCQVLDDQITKELSTKNVIKKWRNNSWSKIYFNYLLLDPRLTNNGYTKFLDQYDGNFCNDFYSAIFYVGKGTKGRPYYHLHQASKLFKQRKYNQNQKLKKIIDIWHDNRGVICLHVFHNSVPAEAYTREAAMIKALGLWNLTNVKTGCFHGTAKKWPDEQKRTFGLFLLYRCMRIYVNEGEKELFFDDFN